MLETGNPDNQPRISVGQQQLVLLVLAVIIVGIAIVIGIRAFTENMVRENADVLAQDSITIASKAIVWKMTPENFGGQQEGGCKHDPSCFNGLNFKKLGYSLKGNPFRWRNANGEFRIVDRKNGLGLEACNDKYRNRVVVEFRGFEPDSIVVVEWVVGTDTDCSM